MARFMTLIPQSFRDRYRSGWYATRRTGLTHLAKIRGWFVTPSMPRSPSGEIYLHLGCGDVNRPGFVNVDGLYAPHVHFVRRIDNLSPFEDGSVALVYACHCLEHFPISHVPTVIAEWYRVLRPGGILRLSVPDFDRIVNIYEENGRAVDHIQRNLMGGQDYRYNFHYTIFNGGSLTQLLKQSGFREVHEWQPGSSEFTSFDDWSGRMKLVNGKEYAISLNLEGIR